MQQRERMKASETGKFMTESDEMRTECDEEREEQKSVGATAVAATVSISDEESTQGILRNSSNTDFPTIVNEPRAANFENFDDSNLTSIEQLTNEQLPVDCQPGACNKDNMSTEQQRQPYVNHESTEVQRSADIQQSTALTNAANIPQQSGHVVESSDHHEPTVYEKSKEPVSSLGKTREPASSITSKGAKENVDVIKIRCVIERRRDEVNATERPRLKRPTQVEMDVITEIPGSLLFQNLTETVLTSHGFDWIDSLGARGTILPSSMWKPVALEAVASDPKATVRDIVEGMQNSIILKIVLQRKFDREPLLRSLLSTYLRSMVASDVFQNSKRPLDKLTSSGIFEENSPLVTSTDQMLSAFCDFTDGHLTRCLHLQNDDQLKHSKVMVDTATNCVSVDAKIDGSKPSRETKLREFGSVEETSKPDETDSLLEKHSNKTNSLHEHCSNKRISLAEKYSNETNSLLEKLFQENPNPTLSDLIGYLDEVNRILMGCDGQTTRSVWTLNELISWFLNATSRASLPSKLACRVESNSLGKYRPSMNSSKKIMTNSSNFDRKRKLLDTSKYGRNHTNSSDLVDRPFVPHLPNSNAVYVVDPLASIENSYLESFDVLSHRPASSLSSSSSSSSSSLLKDEPTTTNVATKCGDSGKNGRQMLSDENHNKCCAAVSPMRIASFDEATDLSLEKRKRKISPSRPPIPVVEVQAPSNSPPSRWPPVKKLEEDGDFETLSEPSSAQITPEPERILHGALPSSFMFPHYSIAGIPPLSLHPHPNTIQMAAMSRLLHQSAAAAAFYSSPQPVFPSHPAAFPAPSSYDLDDHSSPGSSAAGDTERRKRSRVFIDPNTEIPRLEQWYTVDTHPSALQIEQYTNELNKAEYRKRFPKLESKNVQLWFKNHRAKVKRMQNDVDDKTMTEAFRGYPTVA